MLDKEQSQFRFATLYWSVYADNAKMKTGEVSFTDLMKNIVEI